MRFVLPLLSYPHSVRKLLWEHLLFKHQSFVDLRLPQKMRAGIVFGASPEDRQRFEQLRDSSNGIIVISFHFGHFRLAAHAAPEVYPSGKFCQIRYPESPYLQQTYTAIAQLANDHVLMDDVHANTEVLHLDPHVPPLELIHRLRRKEILMFAADGMAASAFEDVPFLDGQLRMPKGWAFLAGLTKSPVVVLTNDGTENSPRLINIRQIIRCESESDDHVREAVVQAAQILEDSLKARPWVWHPWQRLRLELRQGKKWYRLAPSAGLEMPPPVRPDAKSRARVAIVTNSLPPYRAQLHSKIVDQVPEVEWHTLVTHDSSFGRWKNMQIPAEIRATQFHQGEPSNQQPQLRHGLREFKKGGRMIAWLERQQIDLVLCQGYGDLARLRMMRWCHRQGIPCYLFGDANVMGNPRPSLYRGLKYAVVRQALKWCTGAMPCGKYGKEFYERCGTSEEDIFYFPFLPDIELFSRPPSNGQPPIGFRPGRKQLLFSGRLVQDKRPDLLLRAFQKIALEFPDWDLVFLGSGPMGDRLHAETPGNIAERVHFAGLANAPETVASYFANSDAFVLPSDKEPWGVVVIEALAAGLPVVSSDTVGAAADLVVDGHNGRIFRAGDVEDLARALRDVIAALNDYGKHSSTVLSKWLNDHDPIQELRRALARHDLLRTTTKNNNNAADAELKQLENQNV